MSHARHRFCNCYKTFTVCSLLTRCAIWTSKSGPRTVCLVHFDLEMCFAPQQRALFLQLNFQKWSERDVFLTFALANWKSTVFRDFPTFSHTWIFFLLTLSLRWSSLFFSSLLSSDSSHLCFSSVHIVGNLTSKLPSIRTLIPSNIWDPIYSFTISILYYIKHIWYTKMNIIIPAADQCPLETLEFRLRLTHS